MNEMGDIRTTYFGALASGKVQPDDEDVVYSIVNYIPKELLELVDMNMVYLAPPDRIFTKYKKLEDEVGKEEAWERSKFELMYEDYLHTEPEAKRQAKQVAAKAKVRTVWLVCYEKNEEYCHRRLLKEHIEEEVNI